MNRTLLWMAIGLAVCAEIAFAQPDVDPAHIGIEVTPFYNSIGPTIEVGSFSKGLASKDEVEFEATIAKMQKSWDKLTFAETYVAAIRLYDLGYRKESVYWFYSAQYRGRLFGVLVDQDKLGSIGSPGFELLQAQNAFYQLVGPYINGYGFGDLEHLENVLQRVLKEGQKLPDVNAIYRGVKFRDESEWKAEHKDLNDGLSKLLTQIKEQKEEIKRGRIERGAEAKFGKLTNRDFHKRVEPVLKSDKPAIPAK